MMIRAPAVIPMIAPVHNIGLLLDSGALLQNTFTVLSDGVSGLCAEPDVPDFIRLILGEIRLRFGWLVAVQHGVGLA